ncbi:MAG: hypothetical protein B7Z58_15075 [Acidiphilium sp. 37-64-53]|uniref:nitric oxide reductase activation protein NorD n=1 Tax=Acidiphilium TaxID=522 RepID=UPI000BC61CCF|nr:MULTISPECIES: hypothetical protein [Acidiphilium]OYW00539.1 MAG: hypothetical protein B7Z58_15075 [Acidiphilium sp. 37-64-53]OZB23723.1 MAG: hypothetical protein B7X49_15665 [Acidiphilium sp. 34-64-41]HQT86452.1 hypothetical protein [Acidiphilium rubrum]
MSAEQTGQFASLERRLGGFVTALWDTSPRLQAMPVEALAPPGRVSFGHGVVRLPERFRGFAPAQATRLYHAAIAHAGAHLRFTETRFTQGSLKPLQVALISLIEDARVEHLAMRRFPGLRRLFLPFHVASPGSGGMAPALFARLARALIDPDYIDGDAWVEKGRALFLAAADDWASPAVSRSIGGLLGNDLGQMRVSFNAKTYVVEPAYRDDNAGIWIAAEPPPPDADSETWLEAAKITPAATEPPRGPPDEADNQPANAARPAAATEDGSPPIASYPEWDHLIRQARPHWATIRAYPARAGRQAVIDQIMADHAKLAQRLAALIEHAKVSQPRRLRRQAEGDGLDLDACIAAAIDLRAGLSPDPRIHSRTERRHRDLATLVLLDVSHSTNDVLAWSDTSVLALERAAAALLGDAMAGLGDRFAMRAFCSNGRHDVRYSAIKEFDRAFDGAAKRRLAGLAGSLSTRLGAALRHAGRELGQQAAYRRLLLVISDGEPSDIDVGDRRYLVEDARHAVQELSLRGIDVFCVGLDAGGDGYFGRIFGRHRIALIDRIERLPEMLPMIYLRLTA